MSTEYLTLNAGVELKATAKGQDTQGRRFAIRAYTGGAIQVAAFYDPVVVDLEGLKAAAPMTVILDHVKRVGQVFGVAEKIEITAGEINVSGRITARGDEPKLALELADDGVPLQASIGAEVYRREFVQPGRSVTVNGQSFQGPKVVVRESQLKEVSVLLLGADGKTEVVIANYKESDAMKGNNKKDEQVTGSETVATKVEYPAPEKIEAAKSEPEQAKTSPEKVEAVKADPTVNTDDPVLDMRKKVALESQRIADIRKVCAASAHSDIEAKAIAEGWSCDKTELEVLRASRPQAPEVQTGGTGLDQNTLMATACLAAGGNIQENDLLTAYGEQALEAAQRFRGVGIQDFLRLCARVEGRELPLFSGTGDAFIQAAFSTISLPGILSNVANKTLLTGYNYVESAWRRICKIASVKDFKQHTRYRMTADFKFRKVGADGELQHGSLGEQSFTNQADTSGILFSLTRKMIINDDLSAFMDIPFNIGMGAGEAIAEEVWKLLLSNPSSFFSAGNNNYLDGTTSALSVEGLTLAEQLFLDQTKPNGRPLGIAPKLLLTPTALKVSGEQLMSSLKLNETTTANKPKPVDNPHAGKFEQVTSAYLSNASYTGYSSKAWYLFADPNVLPAFEVAFLNGVDRPTVERAEANFNVLGIQFRGYIDFGVKEQEHRGAVKMKGEA